jgi:hypothetical protein
MTNRFILASFALALAATPAAAVQVPGGGSARTDCYARFEVDVPAAVSTREVQCTDGDPACDRDGACNDSCRFGVALCLNQPDNRPTCIPPFPPAALKSVKLPRRGPASGLQVPALDSSACGAFLDVDVPVKLRKHGKVKRPGKQKLNVKAKSPAKPKNDKDQLRLVCLPRTGDCPTTTTTTTLPPVVPLCGDGIVNGTEQCDPPCSDSPANGCAAGQICTGTCQCEDPQPCDCGMPEPTHMRFTTTIGSGTCGTTMNSQGSEIRTLDCGGLYFGGGQNAVPLPAFVPDMGTATERVCCSGTTLHIGPASAAETGSNRNCSSKDCLFGAPLPIPNFASRPISTCVFNVVAENAAGQGDCREGSSQVSLPLRSDVYLFGDLLNGTPDRPDVPGLQPCPICTATCSTLECNNTATHTACTPGTEVADCGMANSCTSVRPCTGDTDCAGGGTCGAQAQCLGGANNGMACTPETSQFGSRCDGGPSPGIVCTADTDCAPGGICSFPYPTSHDCPPPVVEGQPIGHLPIAFNLTTGTTTASSVDLNGAEPSGAADRVFCGFCRDEDEGAEFFGVCVGGDNAGGLCAQRTDCPNGTCGDLVPCTSDDQCSQPREKCRQRNNGAFFSGAVSHISMTGSPAGDLTDGQPHPAKLVSIFCVPAVLDASVDVAADLPGPGATALEGEAQILP